MYAKLPNLHSDPRLQNVGTVALAVLYALASRAPNIRPSVATIAKDAQCGPRAARNALRRLENAGVITTESRPGKATLYRLTPVLSCRPPLSSRAGVPLSSRAAEELQPKKSNEERSESPPNGESSSPEPEPEGVGDDLNVATELQTRGLSLPNCRLLAKKYRGRGPELLSWWDAATAGGRSLGWCFTVAKGGQLPPLMPPDPMAETWARWGVH